MRGAVSLLRIFLMTTWLIKSKETSSVFFAIPLILRKAYLNSDALNRKTSVANVPIVI
jgi:hypothetical protein